MALSALRSGPGFRVRALSRGDFTGFDGGAHLGKVKQCGSSNLIGGLSSEDFVFQSAGTRGIRVDGDIKSANEGLTGGC